MPTALTIQDTYHDALFFASSRINVKQRFYLKPSEYKLLIKLIHYSKTYKEITYQIKNIAKHTFMDECTIKDCLEALKRKGYISIKKDVYHQHLGYASKVTRYINWGFISDVADLCNSYQDQQEPANTTPELPVETKVHQPEHNGVKVPQQDTNTISMKKQELKEKFLRKLKYAPDGVSLRPAEFHALTNDYFIGVDINTILDRIKPYHKGNADEFVDMVYKWVNELKQVA